MVDVNDTGRSNLKLEQQWDLLADADIDERDEHWIEEFVTHRSEVEDKAPSTLINDLKCLRLASVRGRTDLVDMDMADVRNLFDILTTPKDEGGYGLEPDRGGIYSYRRACRVFFRFLADEVDGDRYEFWERIDVPQANLGTSYDREQLLSESEVTALKNHTRNRRDRVLIDFLADVPARISLATSLRVGDISELESDEPTFTPNEYALNLKRVPLRDYPLMYSVGELQTWINIDHPEAHPEAPEPPGEPIPGGERRRVVLRQTVSALGTETAVGVAATNGVCRYLAAPVAVTLPGVLGVDVLPEIAVPSPIPTVVVELNLAPIADVGGVGLPRPDSGYTCDGWDVVTGRPAFPTAALDTAHAASPPPSPRPGQRTEWVAQPVCSPSSFPQ